MPAPTVPELEPPEDELLVVVAPEDEPEEEEAELELAAALTLAAAEIAPEVVPETPAPLEPEPAPPAALAVTPEEPAPTLLPEDPVAAALEVAAAERLRPVPDVVAADAGWMTSPKQTCSAGSQVAPLGQSASELHVDTVRPPELQAERERPSKVRFEMVNRMKSVLRALNLESRGQARIRKACAEPATFAGFEAIVPKTVEAQQLGVGPTHSHDCVHPRTFTLFSCRTVLWGEIG